MSKTSNEEITEKEAFELSYRAFIDALKIMVQDAKSQCELMGNYNVAWEIKDDISGGEYLFDLPGGSLSENQQYAMKQLLHELQKIPTSVLKEATTAEANLEAMSDPCWEGIRKQGLILLRILINH